MANNENADICHGTSINQGVRKTSEWESASVPGCWGAEARVRNQQNCDAIKFGKECARQTDSSLLPIERKSFLKLSGRFGMKEECHRISARNRSRN
jgi:hypothetical protein